MIAAVQPFLPDDIAVKTFALHVCCGPCAGGLLERLIQRGCRPSLLFYNPNIHPRQEYERRKGEIARFARDHDLAFFDGDYDKALWIAETRHLWAAPERGLRCQVCFDLRLAATARFALEKNLTHFATTLGLSRFKTLRQINRAGAAAQELYPPLRFMPVDWRKKGGGEWAGRVAAASGFYRQDYCGCFVSLNDRRRRRTPRTTEKGGTS